MNLLPDYSLLLGVGALGTLTLKLEGHELSKLHTGITQLETRCTLRHAVFTDKLILMFLSAQPQAPTNKNASETSFTTIHTISCPGGKKLI